MGISGIQHTQVAERVSKAEAPDHCDLCGSTRDVAQCIGTMEGPDPEIGGLASLFFICSRCAAYAIQVTTGFRAVKTLASWYQVRERYAKYKGDVTLVNPDTGEAIA